MSDIPTVLRIVSAFAVVVLLLYAFAVVARQRRGTKLHARSDRLITVIETTPLTQNASLHVVKVGERYQVIALTSATVSQLGEIEPATVGRIAGSRDAPSFFAGAGRRPSAPAGQPPRRSRTGDAQPGCDGNAPDGAHGTDPFDRSAAPQ
ncbi:MAG: flagellar biosynthetic protein FliO [Candidatus Velthaea sp.]|jgi:hypothetical protein